MSLLIKVPDQVYCKSNNSNEWHKCDRDQACHSDQQRLSDDSPDHQQTNFITKFNLYCQKDDDGNIISDKELPNYSGVFGSAIGFGDILGSFLFNFLSDQQGRKKILVQGGFTWILVNIAMYFNTSLVAMQVLLFLNGFMSFSNHIVGQNYAGEITDTHYKSTFQVIVQIGDALVWSVVCLFWYQNKNFGVFWWIIIAKHILLITGVALFFVESPEWLFSQGSITEFNNSMNQISKINGREQEQNEHLFLNRLDSSESIEEAEKKTLNPKIIVLMVMNVLIWMVVIFIQQFIDYFITYLKTGQQTTLLIQSVSQVIGYVSVGFLLKTIGSKSILAGGFLVFTIVSFLQQFSENQYLSFILVFAICLTIALAQLAIQIFTAKSFESKIRGTAFAVCNIFGRSMVLLAPVVANNIRKNQSLMSDLMMVLGGVGTILSITLIVVLRAQRNKEKLKEKNHQSKTYE